MMALQEMGWALMDETDVEKFDLSKFTDGENENEFGL